MSNELQYQRRQYLDQSKNPPEFVDEVIPTEPVRIFKQGRSGYTRSVGSFMLVGSYEVGTNQVMQIVFEDFNTNTPNVFFRLHHSRLGTLDLPYLESKGQETRIGDLNQPLESIPPGTFRVDVIGPGSANGAFEGIGSMGVNVFSSKVMGYIL